nr:DUF305 domain-containing protein [Arthrobacter sp. H14]
MKRPMTISALALAGTIALAGCGTDSGTENAGPSASPSSTQQESSPAQAQSVEHNAADTKFAQMMIPHHSQAIEMSGMLLSKEGIDPRVVELAEQIKAAQGPEIEQLEGMLQTWGEPTSTMAEGHSMESMDEGDSMESMESMGEMDGMMSAGQMEKLAKAEGEEAARLFLTQMMDHHMGAVAMAEKQVKNGQNEEAIALAKDIIAAQEAEMKEMKEILGTL